MKTDTNKLKRFIVTKEVSQQFSIEVLATNEEEAEIKAFDQSRDDEWVLDDSSHEQYVHNVEEIGPND